MDQLGLICAGLAANLFVFTPIGALIGHFARGRATDGAGLGFLLGPLGWLCVPLLTDGRRLCDHCRAKVDPKARVCRYCARELELFLPPRTTISGGAVGMVLAAIFIPPVLMIPTFALLTALGIAESDGSMFVAYLIALAIVLIGGYVLTNLSTLFKSRRKPFIARNEPPLDVRIATPPPVARRAPPQP